MHISKLVAIIASCFLVSCSPSHEYTTEEKNYIASNVILWCVRPNSYPFEYLAADGSINGMSMDYLNLITKKTGLQFKISLYGTMAECQSRLAAGTVQLLSAVRATPERSKYANFTRPYVYVETVMLKRIQNPASVGIGRGYAVKNYLVNDRPELKIVEFDDDEAAIQSLIRGTIDAMVLDTESAKQLRRKYRLELDQVSIPFEYPLSFSFRKQDSILRQIFDKAISDITDAEHERIKRKWM